MIDALRQRWTQSVLTGIPAQSVGTIIIGEETVQALIEQGRDVY
ncbi:hypothetical protein ABDX87_18580 [Pseudomonas abietaniphila]